jgi:hypothetical protein
LHAWFPSECFRAEIPEIDQLVESEIVECVTLETLFEKHAVSRIDLLLVDTEGYDLEVLRQFDFRRYRPRLIIYEHKNLPPGGREESERLLRQSGYRVVPVGGNNVAVPA